MLDLERINAELRSGVALDAIRRARRDWAREHRRPAAFSAKEGLQAVEFECILVLTAAGSVGMGIPLSDVDRARLRTAYCTVRAVLDEIAGWRE